MHMEIFGFLYQVRFRRRRSLVRVVGPVCLLLLTACAGTKQLPSAPFSVPATPTESPGAATAGEPSVAGVHHMVRPGQTLNVEVAIDDLLDDAYFMTGRVTVEARPVLRVEFVVKVLDSAGVE